MRHSAGLNERTSVFMLALRSVQCNMLRSLLTILGIVIGVSAVITMVTPVSYTHLTLPTSDLV